MLQMCNTVTTFFSLIALLIIFGLCLIKSSRETLQNLPNFGKSKVQLQMKIQNKKLFVFSYSKNMVNLKHSSRVCCQAQPLKLFDGCTRSLSLNIFYLILFEISSSQSNNIQIFFTCDKTKRKKKLIKNFTILPCPTIFNGFSTNDYYFNCFSL